MPEASTSLSQFIVSNGVKLNVRIAGSGPDVLLVHGFPDDGDVWRKQVPALVGAGFRVIVPDMRGCGDSEMAAGAAAYSLDNLVADLIGVLDTLGVDRVRLVAHDWGAVIGWQFCMRHPERVDRYVALSVGHPNAYARGPLEQKLKGWYVLFFQLRGIAEWTLKARDWSFFRAFSRYPEEARQWISRLSRPGRLTAAISYYRDNLRLLIKSDWPSVSVPVFGIYSTGDAFLAEAQMTDSQRYVTADWRYQRIEGANHWVQLDAPDQVNALLLDYLP